MFLISTRQIKNGKWTYFKVDNDTPQYFHIPDLTQLDPPQLEAIATSSDAVQRMVDEAKTNMPASPMILVFVHGYNNTVDTACGTADTLAGGLYSKGVLPAMVCLSWSTDGKLENYEQDRSDARASALVVSRILHDFAANAEIANGSVSLSVITHSMGNYMVNFACESMGIDSHIPARLFHHSILVAADINRDDLNVGQEGDVRCRLSNQVTFYYDGWDGTLQLAEIVLHRQRFGKLGPHHWDQLYPNTLGVNCSDVLRAHTNDPIEGAWQVGVGIHSSYFADETFHSDLAQTFMGTSPGNITTRRHPDGVPPNSYRLRKPL